jgi:murein DD-endopeptidase MepM/ murein hydrolase activator NlpD
MADKFRSLPGGPGFYAALLLCLAVAGVGGYFLLMDRTPEPTVQEEPAVQEEAAAPVTDLPVQLPEAEPESEPEPEETEDQPVSMPETEVAAQAPVTAEEPLTVVSPLEGDVVAAFSMDQLLYNPTLEDWRTHDGVDIAAAEGSSVLAASAGTVVAVDDDVLMGTTVVIEHSGGYHTLYANLQSPPLWKAGDAVSAGQLIGTVGTSAAAESAQGPHLHFSVTLDGEPVDPASFLKK